MPRPKHPDLPGAPYFVTTRTARSRRTFLGATAATAVDEIAVLRARYGFLLLAYVFMPDHAHLVIVPAEGHTVSQTMRAIKGSIARRLNRERGVAGAVWQEGFRDDVAFTLRELNTYIEYIHDNPVRAGICLRAADYPYSSADDRCMPDYDLFLGLGGAE